MLARAGLVDKKHRFHATAPWASRLIGHIAPRTHHSCSFCGRGEEKSSIKNISDIYHPRETGNHWSRVRAFRTDALPGSLLMIPQKTDVLTCILVVTAALLVGIAKCTGCTSKFP